MVGKPGETGENASSSWRRLSAGAPLTAPVASDKLSSLKPKDKLPISKPKVPAATAKPTKPERRQSTTAAPTTAGTRARPQGRQIRVSSGDSWQDAG